MSAKQIVMAAAGASGPVFIEDIFSTYFYTGNDGTQTITNGIDLAGKGGLVWIKSRSGGNGHALLSNATTSPNSYLATESTAALDVAGVGNTFNSNGFTLNTSISRINGSAQTFSSWTFRKQPKFFDVVTYTGNGANRTIAHNLGSVPGCIIVKRTDTTADWQVYHRSLANTEYLVLNSTAAVATGATRWNSTTPTSTVFSLGTDTTVNASGGTYVAYLFAHDAGGFGLSGTDNVISCGSFTTDGSGNATVTLNYEPQFVLMKSTGSGDSWQIYDSMRGWAVGGNDAVLYPNNSAAEDATANAGHLTATGFVAQALLGSRTYIYIAIRRGPMKKPTTGTSVFTPIARTGTGGAVTISTAGFPVDLLMIKQRDGTNTNQTVDRLRGSEQLLATSTTAAEGNNSGYGPLLDVQSGFRFPGLVDGGNNGNTLTYINHCFRRAPGFFDVVCYTGVGAGTSFTHNLGVAPELIIVKLRSSPVSNTAGWFTYHTALGTSSNLLVHTNAASASTTAWNVISSTTVSFNGAVGPVSVNNDTYVAYLFASCPGVSKVGSYTGNGSSQTINCGFTGGARFVLIKRTDSTGDWYVWDTARGIVAADDPHLSLNSTAAEVTTNDSIDPDNSGFIVNQVAATNINVSSATYIYLAIA